MTSVLPIDNERNSSFLNVMLLDKIENIVNEFASKTQGKKKRRDALKTAQTYFAFQTVFKNRGVQGVTGILKLKGNDNIKIVFKISNGLDRAVEHEHLITEELNKLRPFCPHFVGNLGMINLPISNEFINDPDKEFLFKNSTDYFPSNMLLMEYVSPVSFYHVCKYLSDQSSIVIAQLCQIMMALHFAQQKCSLTHYDLHIDNILFRGIEENTLFLYRSKSGRNILLPTFGLYPVIIDMGSSYVKAVEGKPMYTSAENYDNGLQPTLYDNINDIHHLLISALYYLEDKGYVYDFLRTRFMYLFKNIPLLAEKGWKQLPYNILDLVLYRIKDECPSVKQYKVWKMYQDDIIEILNGLIILPWNSNNSLSFKDCMVPFLRQLEIISNIRNVENGDEVLYILRETVELINKHRKSYQENPSNTTAEFRSEWNEKISFILNNNIKEIPNNLDLEELFVYAIQIADRLSSNYYENIQKHVDIINESYVNTPIKGPLDVVDILLQNATPVFQINKNNTVYVWDAINESKTIINLTNIPDDIMELINNTCAKKKGEILHLWLNN